VPCGHRGAVPVDLTLTGERVAWWCEACTTQLDAAFTPAPALSKERTELVVAYRQMTGI